MTKQSRHITGRTSEFNEFQESIPVHLEAGGFLICTSGSGEVMIDSKRYNIKKGDLIVAFPHSYAHAIHTSDDFDGIIFGTDIDTLINTDLSNRATYITTITQSPSISLENDEIQKILSLREMFLRESAKIEHPLRKEIDDAILKMIIYEVAALFSHSKPNLEKKHSRDDSIFSNFIEKLYSGEPTGRSLEYFASHQHITPSHLSKAIKRATGRAASEWISSYTIVSIKRLLQNRELSISAISDMLSFPNASFLSQYFKKYTSLTPREYRSIFIGKK